MPDASLILLPLMASLVAVLGVQLHSGMHRRAAARAGYLDQCLHLLTDVRRASDAAGFPRVSGCRDGVTYDVQVVPDSLSLRKLPALWLVVSRIEARAGGRVDILRRPSGAEPFTGFANLPCTVSSPDGFPEDCVIRTDHPETALPPAAPLMRALADPRIKEVLLAPSGLRLVRLAEEADRSRYLLYRDAELGALPLDSSVLVALLDQLDALAADLGDGVPASLEAAA